MELALACDLRIAAENARFALPETKLGLLPGGGGTQRLPRLIGLARALDMLISGKTIDAALALEWGIVPRVAGSAQEALDQAIAATEQIATPPTLAIAYVNDTATAAIGKALARGLKHEKSQIAMLTNPTN